MIKTFIYNAAKYEIDEYGNIFRSAYEDDRPHMYNGKIIMLHRHNKRRALRPYTGRDGYSEVILKSSGMQRHFRVHHLVYMIYVLNFVNITDKSIGYNFEDAKYIQINHIDGNKSNNHYSNLERVSLQENIQHAVSNRIHNSQTKARFVEIYYNNKLVGTVWKTREASKWIQEYYGLYIASSTICRCVKNNRTCKGFLFKYKV